MYSNKPKCAPGSFLAGTIAGALIGAGLALLYAPKAGKETREDIKNKVEELKKEAEETKEKAKTKFEEMKKTASNKAEDLKERAKRAAAELKKEEDNSKKS